MPPIGDIHDPLAATIYELLRPALQRWGRCASTDYPALRAIAALRLRCVEQQAATQSQAHNPARPVTDADRQRAVWRLIREAIDSLRPPPAIVSPAVAAALNNLEQGDWPKGLVAPSESHHYLVLFLAYVAKSHPNKNLATLLGVSERTLASIRNAAIAEVADYLARW
jgi:hypothetical protein